MECITTSQGTTVSFEKYGSGPPLVLVHGAFSDHVTNWEFVKPALEQSFTVYAIARRGRGETDATTGHTLVDEANDVAEVIRSVGEPVFLLGHSYGAQCSLVAASIVPELVAKLVLYEAPHTGTLRNEILWTLYEYASVGNWEGFAWDFFTKGLQVPLAEMEDLRASPLWAPIVGDAKASFGDLVALSRHTYAPKDYASLQMPVMLQVGSESPRDFYITDSIARTLPDVWIETLEGQAHEGMTTAPDQYVDSVLGFLLSERIERAAA
jgi:pimeloyl-ACP methyl ester carboxylesterase